MIGCIRIRGVPFASSQCTVFNGHYYSRRIAGMRMCADDFFMPHVHPTTVLVMYHFGGTSRRGASANGNHEQHGFACIPPGMAESTLR
eukprot:symbB.v1.2.025745.t1/scaffold2519.1/size77074/2